MCLIAYSPKGAPMPDDAFDSAANQNSDGCGIMSAYGAERFIGRKYRKRARRSLRRLAAAGLPFAVHFRFATHGAVTLANCHPFQTGDGSAFVMHNGVLSEFTKAACARRSDTRVMVESLLATAPNADAESFWHALGNRIGYANKLVVYHATDAAWTLVNEDAGDWIAGLWYSNEYSLPSHMWQGRSGSMYAREDDYAQAYGYAEAKQVIVRGRRVSPWYVAGDGRIRSLLDRASPTYDAYYREVEVLPGYQDDGTTCGEIAARVALGLDGADFDPELDPDSAQVMREATEDAARFKMALRRLAVRARSG